MKIAVFDIDDTITKESQFLRENAPEFLEKVYGIVPKEKNPEEYALERVYGLKELLVRQNYTEQDAEEKASEIAQAFWNKKFFRYCCLPLRAGVKETIKYLQENGYKIHFVSMRGKCTPNGKKTFAVKIRLKIIYLLTWLQLRKGGVKCDYLKLMPSIEDKLQYIRYSNPQFIFEDRGNLIVKMEEWKDITSKIVCIENLHNKKENLPNGVIRISGYDDTLRKYLDENMTLKKSKKEWSGVKDVLKIFLGGGETSLLLLN